MNFIKPLESEHDILSESFNLEPFGDQLKPIVEESLVECKKTKRNREGTFLTPIFTVFATLGLTGLRSLSYPKVISFLLSAVRWLSRPRPKNMVSEGSVTKARQYLGIEVFRLIFDKFVHKHCNLPADFHVCLRVIFDGVTATLPDTPTNQKEFGKPSNKRGSVGFPLRSAVALMSVTLRCIIGIAYGPYKGKGTFDVSLMAEILQKFQERTLLFLLDAGLYSFEILEHFKDNHQEFLMKIQANIKVKRTKQLSDGSYVGVIRKKYKNPASTPKKRLPPIIKEIIVRVIPYQIYGFYATRLITNILDENITARELVAHYHKRWDIEIAFDEIKTHQCATLRGQAPTVFRSKTPSHS